MIKVQLTASERKQFTKYIYALIINPSGYAWLMQYFSNLASVESYKT